MKMRYHRLILLAALVVILALALSAGKARPGTVAQLLPSGDTLYVDDCDSARIWIGMAATAPTPGILSWTRVYPYLKPIGTDLGSHRGHSYSGAGFGYALGRYTSASIEWRHVWGCGSEYSLTTKLSLR